MIFIFSIEHIYLLHNNYWYVSCTLKMRVYKTCDCKYENVMVKIYIVGCHAYLFRLMIKTRMTVVMFIHCEHFSYVMLYVGFLSMGYRQKNKHIKISILFILSWYTCTRNIHHKFDHHRSNVEPTCSKLFRHRTHQCCCIICCICVNILSYWLNNLELNPLTAAAINHLSISYHDIDHTP